VATEPPPVPVSALISKAGTISWALLGILALGFVFFRYALAPVSVLVAPLIVAVIIVYLLHPLVTWLQRFGVPRALSVAAVFSLFLVGMSWFFSWLVPAIVSQVSNFVDEAPELAHRFVGEINDFAAARGFSWRLDVSNQEIADFFRDNRDQIVGFLGGLGNVAGQIVHLGVTLVIGIILSIYLLVDLPGMQERMRERIPPVYREEASQLGLRISSAIGGFFRGQFLVALFVGVASALALTWPVGLPFAVLVGLIAGIFNLIPLIGPFLATIPAVILGITSDRPSKALYAVIALLVVQQIDNHIISPNVMGRTVQLHPITVMLGLLVGGTTAGIFGMLVTIPIIAIAKILGTHLWSRQRARFVSLDPFNTA
jgi:predicted PurR-regulated permease PerM